MQCLGQANLAGEAELDDTTTAAASGTGARAREHAQLDARWRDAEHAVQREHGRAEGVDRDVAGEMGGRGDDAGASEADVHVGFGEGREQGEREEEVGDSSCVVGGKAVLNYIANGAGVDARDGAGDQTGLVCDGGARVRDIDDGTVGNGLDQTQERDFVGGETRVCGTAAADLGDVHRAAGEGRENDPFREGAVAREANEFGFLARHGRRLSRVFEFTLSRVVSCERCKS